MVTLPKFVTTDRILFCSRCSGDVLIAIGVSVLAGWTFHIDILKSFAPGLNTAKPSAAISLVFLGLALRVGTRSGGRLLTQVAAALIGFISLVTLVEYAASIDLGIDHLFFDPDPTFPGRIAPMAALGFLLLVPSLLLIRRGARARSAGEWMAAAAGLLAIVAILAHINGVRQLYSGQSGNLTALPIALGLLIGALGILFSLPETRATRIFADAGLAGIVARRLLPVVIAVPLLIRWVFLIGYHAGWYGDASRSILTGTTTVALFTAVAFKLMQTLRGREEILRQTQEAEGRLAAIVASSEDAIWSHDLSGIVTSWNPGAERMFGYTEAEILGRSFAMIVPPEVREREDLVLENLRSDEPIPHYETERVNKAGEGLAVFVSVAKLSDSGGRVVGASRIARDITEQKLAQQKLAETEREFEALANLVPQLVWMADPNGWISWYNQRWYEYTGTNPAQMETREGRRSAHHPEVLPRILERWHESVRTGTPFEMVFPLRGKDGVFRPFLSRGVPLRDEQGRIVRWFGTNTDITAQKETEDVLRTSQRELERRVQERTAELNASLATLENEIRQRQQAEHEVRELSGRLLRLQDEERRRISRELHDSAAQLLVGLDLNLMLLERSQTIQQDANLSQAAAMAGELGRRLNKELRTMSYLLHPPLLEEAGLVSALEWLIDGFSQRSEIATELEISPEIGRLAPELELTAFRIVQECLTNIHRHSGSHKARIELYRKGPDLAVEVRDWGRGMPEVAYQQPSGTAGVGIGGMRERVRQLKGILQIRSGATGTTILALLPASVPEPVTGGTG